jgi:hypothetical protein
MTHKRRIPWILGVRRTLRVRRTRRVRIVVATRDSQALAALEQAAGSLDLERREALSTEGLYRALPGAHLAVVDPEALVESPGMSRERLAQVLDGADVAVVSGPAFAADPQVHLDRARAASGLAEALPARAVAFTGLTGGVGKTTLALSLARYFRRRTGLPAVVIELSSGPSGLLALLGRGEEAHLYETITQGKEWPAWNGVRLAPMEWESAELLPEERVSEAWGTLRDGHVLTVFDAPAYHPLWPLAARLAGEAFVVADSRPDALAAAVYLASRDQDEETQARVLLNRGGLPARLALDRPPAAALPDVGRAARSFPDRLGRPLMRLAYAGWRG